MVDRGFGLELEETYGEVVAKSEFEPDFWSEADSVDFKLNDEAITKSGTSRMDKRARAGIMKPTGSTQLDADLERMTWFCRLFLDNYKYTAGSGDVHTHEFWGGEGKELASARIKAVYDMLVKYIYGAMEESFSIEVSDDSVSISNEWIYSTEKADIIGQNGATFERPAELEENIFLMFYDVSLKLNNKALDGVSTAFSYEGNNNFDVDATIGLGSRYPQKRALAGKRENSLSITTSLTSDTVRSILDAEYGEVGALEPSSCKLLQVPLEVNINLCEDADISCKMIFPKCTLNVEYDMSGADNIEVTMNLATLGSGSVTLADGETTETTDMYIKLVNYQEEIVPKGA